MADGKRRLAVVVEIATEGERCRDWLDPGPSPACQFFNGERGTCNLFNTSLGRIEVDEEGRFLRAYPCLALDEVPDVPALPHRRRRCGSPPRIPRARLRGDARGRRYANSPLSPNPRGRAATMAQLYKRGKTWWVSWSRTERESLRTKDKQAAEIAMRRRERERADPTHAAAASTTLSSCLTRLFADRRARGRAPDTLAYYERKAGQLVRVLGDDTPLALVTAELVDGYVSQRVDEGASQSTVAKELGTLRSALRLAKRLGRFSADVSAVLPLGYGTGYTPRTTWLSEDQLTRLLAELQPHRARHVAYLAATGARLGESYRARREDVSGARVDLRGTKTAASRRTIEVPDYARPLLERALDGAPASGVLHLPWGSMTRDLEGACRRASVPRVTANDLRRTASHWLRQRGVEAGLVAPWLGHVDTRMVERVYGRLDARELADAIGNRVDAARVRPVYAPGTVSVDLRDALDRLGAAIRGENLVARDGIEPPTRGFSILRARLASRPVLAAERSRVRLLVRRLYALAAAANDVLRAAG